MIFHYLNYYSDFSSDDLVNMVLAKDDVVFCQYREQGVFQQRGFQLSDFMNQLFANHKDPGKGRNMPVHYGSRALHIVSLLTTHVQQAMLSWLTCWLLYVRK